MQFRSFDSLRIFNVVGQHLSFTAAAKQLNLTKGAVSYQIKQLESDLGFEIFKRSKQGIELTDKGRRLLVVSQTNFNHLLKQITMLRDDRTGNITVGMSTYFASRWLSPRLMNFMSNHSHIGLRIQPLIDLHDLAQSNLDMAIRWGKGEWTDGNMRIELLFNCPAFLTGGANFSKLVENDGIEMSMRSQTLLHDRDNSNAWRDWCDAAGIDYLPVTNNLVIPDPNVRVQAVINHQGIALNDVLVSEEISNGKMFQYMDVELRDYGYYLVYPQDTLDNSPTGVFRDWLLSEANHFV